MAEALTLSCYYLKTKITMLANEYLSTSMRCDTMRFVSQPLSVHCHQTVSEIIWSIMQHQLTKGPFALSVSMLSAFGGIVCGSLMPQIINGNQMNHQRCAFSSTACLRQSQFSDMQQDSFHMLFQQMQLTIDSNWNLERARPAFLGAFPRWRAWMESSAGCCHMDANTTAGQNPSCLSLTETKQ